MRNIKISSGEFYHVYNRGVDKRIIFEDIRDYERFLASLFLFNSNKRIRIEDILPSTKNIIKDMVLINKGESIVAIGAYCLMPNHFHLLITPLVENGMSSFMQKLQTSYTMYFNNKNSRTGSLFQGTFKAEHANRDEYLKYLYSYIHLNPAKIIDKNWRNNINSQNDELKNYILSYPYSSNKEYLNSKHVITNPSVFPKYFTSVKDFSDYLSFWLISRPQV